MKATFQLDGCHTLSVTDNVPRHAADPASVSIQLDRAPLPTVHALPDGSTGMTYAPTECVFSTQLVPSYARAIASALLSAATEAKR